MKAWYCCLNRLLAFQSGISLASNIGGGATSLAEEARKDRVDDGSEDDLGAIGRGEGHPQDQDELEDVVERCRELVRMSGTVLRITYGTSRQH